jgi:hypothetical protein
MRANWVITKSLQCSVIRLLVTCTNIMLILVQQDSEDGSRNNVHGILGHMRLYNHVDLHLFYAFRYLVYIDYMGYLSNIFIQNLGLLDTLQNLKSTGVLARLLSLIR